MANALPLTLADIVIPAARPAGAMRQISAPLTGVTADPTPGLSALRLKSATLFAGGNGGTVRDGLPSGGPTALDLVPGKIAFVAELDPSNAVCGLSLGLVEQLVGAPPAGLWLHGHFDETHLSAELALGGDAAGVTFGGITLKEAGIRIDCLRRSSGWQPTAPARGVMGQTRSHLVATLCFGTLHPVAIGLAASLETGTDMLMLQGTCCGVTLGNGLSDIADLCGIDVNLEEVLPDPLKSLNSLGLLSVSVGLSCGGGSPRPSSVSVLIGNDEPANWDILPGLLTLEAPQLLVTATGLDTGDRQVNVMLKDDVVASTATFDVLAVLPIGAGGGVQLQACLSAGHLPLGILLDKIMPSGLDEGGLASLSATRLAISGEPKSRHLTLDVGIAGAWHILDELALTDLSFSFALDGAGGARGDVASEFVLGSGATQMRFSASARHPGHGRGWIFSAELSEMSSGATRMPLPDFIAKCLAPFKLKDQPLHSVLAAFEIADVSIAFETVTKDFRFVLDGVIVKAGGPDMEACLTLDLIHLPDGSGHEMRATGLLRLTLPDGNALEFELALDHAPGSTTSLAAFASSVPLHVSIADVARAAGLGDVPAGGLSFALRQAMIARSGGTTLFDLDIDAGLDLSNIRIGGLEIAGGHDPLTLAFKVLLTDAAVTTQMMDACNALLPPGMTALPVPDPLPGQKDILLDTKLICGDFQAHIPLDLKLKTASTAPPDSAPGPAQQAVPPAVLTASAAAGDAPPHWQPVHRRFGPVRIDKVGFALQGSKIHATIFGNIALGGLTLSLINLGVTSPISNPAPSFTLDGLGLDYRNGAVEIGGALMRSTRLVEGQEASVFSGFCVLKTRTLSMQVAASFCKMDKATSLFVYGALLAPLGGPAFFMVTGLAAGFGLHRRLIMPELADMPSFPLVATVMHKDGPAPFETMLPQLDACLPPASGENFFCIGVKFTTFKIIESFALLAVQFGTRTEIDVLGLSELTVPPGVPAGTPLLAKADLALKAVFLPDEGTLMVRAALTPDSYVLSPDCHLTGGFAMSSWFAGPYAGQFVLSIGGYHPAFRVPAHFPQDIQRLGFNWIVSGSLTFKGEMYFALTGNCLMAGGAFLAAYEGGSARAWFGCGADFIVTFKPFHYDATLYIDMGVDVTVHFFGTHHFSLRAHADLHLWGPPLAGHAHISLKVIGIKVSFDADFGSSRPLMLPIDWAEFEQSFLPPTKEICAISIVEGLICEAEEDGCKVSVVNPHTLRVQVESAVPSEMITLDGEDITGSGTRPSSFNIYPMGLSNTPGPSLDLAIAGPSKAFVSAPVRKPAPAGLWGQPVRVNGCYLVPPDLNHDALVPSLLHGLGLSAGAANATSSHCVNRDDLIHPDPRLAPGTWRWQAAPDAAQRVEMTAEGLNDALRAANAARDSLIRDLNLAAVLRDLGEDSSLGLNAMPSKAA